MPTKDHLQGIKSGRTERKARDLNNDTGKITLESSRSRSQIIVGDDCMSCFAFATSAVTDAAMNTWLFMMAEVAYHEPRMIG